MQNRLQNQEVQLPERVLLLVTNKHEVIAFIKENWKEDESMDELDEMDAQLQAPKAKQRKKTVNTEAKVTMKFHNSTLFTKCCIL